jgi:TPP-dependent pyruvate/acetoin dehydrogenase alpha subunit
VELLRAWIRAEALEALLSGASPGLGDHSPVARPVGPALPAALALRPRADGTGDIFSLRVGSPAAALVLGETPEALLRQALGRTTAPAGGRDPGGFSTDLDCGLLGPVTLPGLLMEVMAGIALSIRMRGEDRVVLLVDDTAGSGSGDWHEGLNFAAVRQVPLVVVMDDTRRRPTEAAVDGMSERAVAYGFDVHPASGSDPEAVLSAVRAAVVAARAGRGLQVVDVRRGDGDPLTTLTDRARESGGLDDDTLDALRRAAVEEMGRALETVRAEPVPDAGALLPTPLPTPRDLPRVRTPRPWS